MQQPGTIGEEKQAQREDSKQGKTKMTQPLIKRHKVSVSGPLAHRTA